MWRPAEMGEPQFGMVAVRLLEAAVVLLLAVTTLELWVGYGIAGQQPDPATGEMLPGAFGWRRLVEAAGVFAYRGPISVMVAAAFLVGITAVLAGRQPVANAEALRWESAVLGCGTALLTLVHLGAGGAWLAMMKPEPNAPYDSRLQQSASLFWPLVGLALVALFFLWWTRLPDPDHDGEADAGAADQHLAQPDEIEEPAGRRDQETTEDAFARVEQIDPVDRLETLQPLSADGGTPNGYDEFFRRR